MKQHVPAWQLPDNAAMESFFGTLKSEFFYLNSFDSIESLEAGLVEYIQYYNRAHQIEIEGPEPGTVPEQAQQAHRPPDPCPSLGVTSGRVHGVPALRHRPAIPRDAGF